MCWKHLHFWKCWKEVIETLDQHEGHCDKEACLQLLVATCSKSCLTWLLEVHLIWSSLGYYWLTCSKDFETHPQPAGNSVHCGWNLTSTFYSTNVGISCRKLLVILSLYVDCKWIFNLPWIWLIVWAVRFWNVSIDWGTWLYGLQMYFDNQFYV